MAAEKLLDQVKDLKPGILLTPVLVFSAWTVIGLVLTNSLEIEIEVLSSAISLALIGPLAYFWKDMDSPAGETWRNIIGVGIIINLCAVGFVILEVYSLTIIELSILYWVAVPGYGFMVNRNFMRNNSKTYMILAHISSITAIAFFVGSFQIINYLVIIATVGTGLIQGIGVYNSLNSFLN
jgi:hypothetical protein